jgi:4-hydroxy-2-oxoglutarate aldolase
MKLSGVFAALTTPFTLDDKVDGEHLRRNIERYNSTALSGYVLNGSTGEAVLLKWSEAEEVWAIAKKAAAPGKLLIAGTGAESTRETIEYTKRAHALGCDAALVRTPHYYRPLMALDVLVDFYKRVADASQIPILVYSIPQYTGIAVEADLIARVADHPNIVGLKDSSGSVERVSQIRSAAPDSFRILVGGASTFYASLQRGAAGGILALASALPELCAELYEAATSRDSERAAAIQERITLPSSVLVNKYGIPGLKFALDQLGYCGGLAREPLPVLSDAAKKEILGVLAGVQLLPAGRSA